MIEKLRKTRNLGDDELLELLQTSDPAVSQSLKDTAREVADSVFGKEIYLRALIEWSNVCRNDCLYCGIRKSNAALQRYTLTEEEILECCAKAWEMGLRTFVLQGGENPAAAERLVPVVRIIRTTWPGAAITLSLGELPFSTYKSLRDAGADRYLLRHETASAEHYERLHPASMQLQTRLQCLQELRSLGFQTGAGMMIGSPWQTPRELLADIRFLQEFKPEMIGIGPFIPQKDTPLGHFPAGSAELTLRLIAILRLMLPHAMIPSTTALSSLMPGGRMACIAAGANVVMPCFTPAKNRGSYALYDGKSASYIETEQNLNILKEELAAHGYTVSPTRGDYKN